MQPFENESYPNPTETAGNVTITIFSRTCKVSYQLAVIFFVHDKKGHNSSRGRKEKLDLKLIS